MDCATVVPHSSAAAFAEPLQPPVFGALQPGNLAALSPSTSMIGAPTWTQSWETTAQLALHFLHLSSALCPSLKIRDLSCFGYSSSVSLVAFMLTPEKARKGCYLEPSESTELMTNVTKYAVFYFAVVWTQFDVFQNFLWRDKWEGVWSRATVI